jgi:membrane fusion protein, multidrug efflux system
MTMKCLLLTLLLAQACGKGTPARSSSPSAPTPVSARAPQAEPDAGFIGVVVAGESVELGPQAEARVEEVLVRTGQDIRKGDPLARLDVRAAEHELAAARAALVDARRRLGRRQRLARGDRGGAVTVEELDSARREVAQESGRVAQLRDARAQALLRAPFDGVVVDVYLAPGALAGPSRPVARLVGRAAPRVRFAVPEDRARGVDLGRAVDVRLRGADQPLRGRVTGVEPEIDTSSRMIYAAAALDSLEPDAQSLSTGLIARVFLTAPVQNEPLGQVGPAGTATTMRSQP